MTPSTAAGRALLYNTANHSTACFWISPGDPCDCRLPELIRAIEAEARLEAEERR